MLCVHGVQRRSSLSTERAERWIWLLVASEHQEIDEVEVTDLLEEGSSCRSGQPQGRGLVPVFGSSVGRVPKNQTSDSNVVAECSKPVIIFSSWKLFSVLLSGTRCYCMLSTSNQTATQTAGKMFVRLQCP